MSAEETLRLIKEARDVITQARHIKCVCGSFALQYNQGCECVAGKAVQKARKNFWHLINEVK